jgi:hypothetical protein
MNTILDKFSDEELLLELINRNVMGEAFKITKRHVPFNEVCVGIGNDECAYITLAREAFKDLCDIVYNSQKGKEIDD